MWRYCYYNTSKSTITEFTWNQEGERVELTTPFKPFLLLESEAPTKIKSIYGTSLYRKDFDNSFMRWKFTDDYDGKIFFNLSPEQQYLMGKYRKEDSSKFMKNDVRIFFLDIESPAEKEFPKPEEANYEIDLMTIYDSLTKTYHMWGKHPYDSSKLESQMGKMMVEKSDFIPVTEKDIQYYHIEDEHDRLEHMVTFWENNCPDIYTGWNSDGFDTPYIINRLRKLFGQTAHLRLSPVNKVTIREGLDQFKNPTVTYKIVGVNCMDYMDVFKTFTFNAERPSWKLDDVANDELNCGKVDTQGMSLYELSRKKWDTYCDYNLVDVALLVSMEAKRNFLAIGRQTAYLGFSNITDCLGKIVTITGCIAKMALDRNVVIETRKPVEPVTFEGGYVLKPEMALRTNIYTFDFTSLYPVNMMTLGVSLETKVGKILHREGDDIIFNEGDIMMRKNKHIFNDYLRSKNYCISCADVIFDKSKRGVVNDFVTEQFNNKAEYKRLANEAKDKGDEEAVIEYQRLGQITKIFLNSCYGVISAFSSPLFDLDCARSITLTGQAVLKKSVEIANSFSKEAFGINHDVVIGGDTDSIFCEFTEIVKKHKRPLFHEDGLTEFGHQLSKLFEMALNKGVNDWVKERMLCDNPTYNMEREKSAETALFFAKKQYAYYVKNNEGYDLPEDKRMKYSGLKVIKSEYSEMLKGMMNELYHQTLSKYLTLGKVDCRKHINEIIKKHKEEFFNATFFDVSKRQRANNLIAKENDFISRYKQGLHCPIQAKSTILYNRLVEDLDLKGKYPPLYSGAKVMWVYVEPNQYGTTSMSGVDGMLPEEFGINIDYNKQWNVLYLKVAQQLYKAVKWSFPNIYHEEMVDFDELFGEDEEDYEE